MISDNPLFHDGTLDRITFDGTITKRERFAMAAMQGLCANPALEDWFIQDLAQRARKQADATIAELESHPDPS
jgi:2,4-dienoyl-CoA reductase-like NADH-dependent reductase (Old Yellow Enzyme family)